MARISAAVWDYGAGMRMLRAFWDSAIALDAAAEKHDGSWWIDWQAWAAPHGGAMVPARTPGDGQLEPIEDAPGSYVKQRAM